MSNNSYDHENKVNLKTLEGIDEIFTDKLEEIGVLDLAAKESVKYGTYENNFTCLQADKAETDDCDVETKIIDANPSSEPKMDFKFSQGPSTKN